jgi:hypothetical protein
MFSLYAATIGPEQWIRFDNAALARTPGAAIQGTECLEPGSAPAQSPASYDGGGVAAVAARDSRADGVPPTGPATERNIAVLEARTPPGTGAAGSAVHRLADAIDLTSAASARLTFQSWFSNQAGSQAEVQASVDGVTWVTIGLVPASGGWQPIDVDLSAFVGGTIEIRFVLDAGSAAGVAPDVWRIAEPRVEIHPEMEPAVFRPRA